MVAPIELNAGVPSTIREQFDVARNAFVFRGLFTICNARRAARLRHARNGVKALA
jgi:hypothetical protein